MTTHSNLLFLKIFLMVVSGALVWAILSIVASLLFEPSKWNVIIPLILTVFSSFAVMSFNGDDL